MSMEIPSFIREKWNSTVSGIRAYKGVSLIKAWEVQTCKTMVSLFPPHSLGDMPVEIMNIHSNLDYGSLEHLWVKTFHSNMHHMSLGQIRFLIDEFLASHAAVKLSPAQYSDWIGELLLLLNATEETGAVTKEHFLKLFPLWVGSRVLRPGERRAAIQEIVYSWNYLDISDCGVLSETSVSDWLLPFAFRKLYPQTGGDDTDLKDAWLKMMMPKGAVRKSHWINKWSEFLTLSPLAFVEELETTANAIGLGRQALMFLGVTNGSIANLQQLLSLSKPNKQSRSRAFSLWLVTLDHGRSRFTPFSIADSSCKPAPLLTIRDSREMCNMFWTEYLGEENLGVIPSSELIVFTDWSNKLLTKLALGEGKEDDSRVILRDELVSRFLTESELDSLWSKFAVLHPEKIKPGELRKLLLAAYRDRASNSTEPGEWVVEQWMCTFVKMCSDLGFLGSDEITKDIFYPVFPLFFAAHSLTSPTTIALENEAVASVWPLEGALEVVYSEPTLRNLLREIWPRMVPQDLNMPCQDWWLDRCVLRLKRAGKGVSRSMFSSLFLSQDELETILTSIPHLNQEALAMILSNAADPEIGPECMEEFYLLTDLKHRAHDADHLSAISRDAFRTAFPLWLAANGS